MSIKTLREKIENARFRSMMANQNGFIISALVWDEVERLHVEQLHAMGYAA